jgi:ArsR family transcriptional regulator, arsenate/arsenite/antimonite-responsive transcriptional repressor
MQDSRELLDFVKAMADVDRLRIIGILAMERANQSEIADRLNMPLREVVNHLAFLEHVGVLTVEDNLYELNTNKLENLARVQLREEKEEYIPAPGLDEKSRKVLASCLNPDGTIKQLPPQLAKLKVILEYLVQAFTPGLDYTEKEVNTIIRRFHVDVSGLRRDLVDAGLLDRERDGSRYWRPSTMDFDTVEKNSRPTQPSAQDESGQG